MLVIVPLTKLDLKIRKLFFISSYYVISYLNGLKLKPRKFVQEKLDLVLRDASETKLEVPFVTIKTSKF